MSSKRPSTNQVNRVDGNGCCPTVETVCGTNGPLFGPSSGKTVRTRLESGACFKLTAYTLPVGTEISVHLEDGADCGSGLSVPFMRCGAPLVITPEKPVVTICGPGWLVFNSTATEGVPYVVAETESADKCCEECVPDNPPLHLFNGDTAPVALSSFLTIAPSGRDGYIGVFNAAAFCAAVNACIPAIPPLTLQQVLGTLPAWLGASGSGDDIITFSFSQAGFDAAVLAAYPDQTVTGTQPTWLTASANGENEIVYAFDAVGFCNAVNACVVQHPAAALTNNAAPFSWNSGTQAGNIPQVATLVASGVNQWTFTPGDGTAATIITIPAVPVQTPLAVNDTATVDLTASGTDNHTLQADVKVSATAGNTLAVNADGLYVPAAPASVQTPLTANDTPTVDLSASGLDNHTLQAAVKISASAGNTLAVNADGLFVPPVVVPAQTPLVANDTPTVDLTAGGVDNHTLQAAVKISAAAGNAVTVNADGLFVAPAPSLCDNLGALSVAPASASDTILARRADGSCVRIAVCDAVGLCATALNADVSVTKSVSLLTGTPGTPFDFVITVYNAGPDAADNTVLTDVLPAGFSVSNVAASFTGGASSTIPTSGALSGGFVIPTLPALGECVYTITGTVAAPGAYNNQASVQPPASVIDPVLANNTSAVVTHTAAVVTLSADLAITKTVDQASALVGQQIEYTVTITNNGPDAANGAIITDVLPAGFVVDSILKNQFGGAVTALPDEVMLAAGHPITTFPAGGSVVLTILGDYSGGGAGSYNNTATITSPGGVPDPVPGNNSATVAHTATLQANLSVTKTVLPLTGVAGTPFTYTVTVSNTGPSAANGAIVTDSLPAGFTVTGIVATYGSGAAGGTPTALDLAGGYAITTLPNGGSASFAVTGTVATAGAYNNQATVAAPVGVTDPVLGNNTSAVVTHTATAACDPCAYTVVATARLPHNTSNPDCNVMDVTVSGLCPGQTITLEERVNGTSLLNGVPVLTVSANGSFAVTITGPIPVVGNEVLQLLAKTAGCANKIITIGNGGVFCVPPAYAGPCCLTVNVSGASGLIVGTAGTEFNTGPNMCNFATDNLGDGILGFWELYKWDTGTSTWNPVPGSLVGATLGVYTNSWFVPNIPGDQYTVVVWGHSLAGSYNDPSGGAGGLFCADIANGAYNPQCLTGLPGTDCRFTEVYTQV